MSDVEEMVQEIEENAIEFKRKKKTPVKKEEEAVKEEETIPSSPKLLIPSGCATLNLACSDRIDGAYLPGCMANLIGDSSSGKTYLALTMLADVAHNPAFDHYRLIHDDVEHANMFNIPQQFGTKLAERLESPGYSGDNDDVPRNSDTIQDFQVFVDDALKDGRPFIYVLDSLDALTSRTEQDTAEKNMNCIRKGTQESGSYGMDKPKALSQFLRLVVSKISKTKSFLLIISQTRDNISPMAFTQKTRSGGRALKFYCSHEIWLAEGDKEKRRERIIGKMVHAKVTKNKITGNVREVEFPVYNEYGVDNIGACIVLLTKEKVWKKADKAWIGGTVISGFESFVPTITEGRCTRDRFIRELNVNKLEPTLYALTEKTWTDIEASLTLGRPPKYSSSPAVQTEPVVENFEEDALEEDSNS